jgi:hypothetical protein
MSAEGHQPERESEQLNFAPGVVKLSRAEIAYEGMLSENQNLQFHQVLALVVSRLAMR